MGFEDFLDFIEYLILDLGLGYVCIKICMDIDVVIRINKIRDRFWDFGLVVDFLIDLCYVWGGFVYL